MQLHLILVLSALILNTSLWLTASSFYSVLIPNVLLGIVTWFLLRQQQHIQQLQQERQEFAQQLSQLLQQLHLPLRQGDTLLAQLRLLGDSHQAQARREQEIRHLVRVQGLIDHDLAIGNRIFFESKLHYYLTESQEAAQGCLYLLQLSQPVNAQQSGYNHLQRLTACTELIAQLTSGYTPVVLARIADTDIAVLIPGIAQKEAEALGDRLVALVSRLNEFNDIADYDALHLGFVMYQQGQQPYQVMAEADMALKTAQLQGPNAAYGFIAPEKPKIKGSVWWRTELTNALQEQRFMLSFQPVFSWSDSDVIEHEVLVRLQSSEGDKLAAAVFLPMAANCGLCEKIDQYVLLRAAKLCQQEATRSIRCSVNLSVESLLSRNWRQWLQQMVQEGQIQPQMFAFEINEFHLNRQCSQLKAPLQQLQQLGFGLLIDQVGISMDACPYLSDFAIDAVKLHPSVVRDVDQQLEQQLFIRGLVASHSQKGVRVIATGVENLREWQVLQRLGVSAAQGYYFSQPLADFMQHESLH
jgi:RNase E specificity factor CsrD